MALLLTLGVSSAGAPAVYADDDVPANAKVVNWGPPKDPPKAWEEGGQAWGLTAEGNYCILDEHDGCNLVAGEKPGTPRICEAPDGMASDACSKEEKQKFEEEALAKWQKSAKKDGSGGDYQKQLEYLTKCVKKEHKPFKLCLHLGNRDHADIFAQPATTPLDWVGGKISEMASDALKEAARYIGESVVWLLEAFANAFNSWSTIDLVDTGISNMLGISLSLSVVIAAFLLIIQSGKVAISQDGGPFVTAASGLVKWAAILAVYTTATQVALDWSDELSTWIINYTFEGGGSGERDAQKAMSTQLGKLFSGLTVGGSAAAAGGAMVGGSGFLASAVGVVIVIGILCILAIAALWVEMMMRQAAIMILVVSMPIVLAGQMADSTRDWWPKARNALIATILAKPVIVMCFGIGFGAMTDASGVRNVLVGFMVFVLAGIAWPVLARFMIFTSNGDGNSAASGIISSVGSSLSSAFGGYQPAPSGAGVVGGGAGYTRALEDDNTSVATSGSNGASGGSFWGKASASVKSFGGAVAGPVGLGFQVAAVGKDTLESTGQSTAAHAGLGPAASGGRHVVVPPRRSGGAQESEPERLGMPAAGDEGSDSIPAPEPAPAGEAGPPATSWDSGSAPAAGSPPLTPAPARAPSPGTPALAPEPSAIDPGAANWNGPRPREPEPDTEGS
ncbi:hypothetical protein [Streptomyces sp. DH12]|uniref:hypothetical protein n=1 Tax=Streptomyces sp. DH12 TaxID=2857010 RepID=UPI001E2AC865|nr:hypothetical protein [Streptomyces sp. DH12]